MKHILHQSSPGEKQQQRTRERVGNNSESEVLHPGRANHRRSGSYLTFPEKEGGVPPKVGHHCPNEPAIWSDPSNCPRVVGWTDKATTLLPVACYSEGRNDAWWSEGLRGCPSEVSLVPRLLTISRLVARGRHESVARLQPHGISDLTVNTLSLLKE
ncbi:hypothetical protein TNCV_3757821 [Trichonephila clavipes]|nr:hypothetical protein TNCV_3757821 [Trichonephila clavipes]